MVLNLSPAAIQMARQTAKEQPLQQFVEGLFESLFCENSCYIILQPIPEPEKMKAIQFLVGHIINEPFFGVKFLTQEEAIEQAEAQQKLLLSNFSSHKTINDALSNQVCALCYKENSDLYMEACPAVNVIEMPKPTPILLEVQDAGHLLQFPKSGQ